MKLIIRKLAIILILMGVSCTNQSSEDLLSGKWQGYVTERGKSTLVELNLRSAGGNIEGTFTILSETGEDIEKGMSFNIVHSELSGNILKFVVPVTGEVDDDAIAFELLLETDRLKGSGRELRKGSKSLPITFTKQK